MARLAVVTAAGRDKLMIPTDRSVLSQRRWWWALLTLAQALTGPGLETRLVRTRGGVEVAQAPVGVLGAYARNQLGVPAQTLTSAVDGFFRAGIQR